jgi:2-phosphoglycerate kinase
MKIISTDTIRQILRDSSNQDGDSKNELLFSSSYNSWEIIEKYESGHKPHSTLVIEGFKRHAELIYPTLEKLILHQQKIEESVIVEVLQSNLHTFVTKRGFI